MPDRKFVYCEAYPQYGRWHIREVGREGLKPGGGCPPPLCCQDKPDQWHNGWDLPDVPIQDDAHEYTRVAAEKRLADACPVCVERYRKAKE